MKQQKQHQLGDTVYVFKNKAIQTGKVVYTRLEKKYIKAKPIERLFYYIEIADMGRYFFHEKDVFASAISIKKCFERNLK